MTTNRRRAVLVAAVLVMIALALGVKWKGGGSPSATATKQGTEGVAEARAGSSRGAGRSLPGVATEDVTGISKGTVVDAQSRAAIPGAAIVVRDGTPFEEGAILAETLSDANGRFELPCGEDRFLMVRAAGYAAGPRRLQCKDGWLIELTPGVRIDGIVVTAGAKRPIEGARVYCTEWGLGAIDETRTDGEGAFALASCAPGELTLVATHPKRAPGRMALGKLEPGARRTGIVLELADGRTLTGRVVDAEGVPMPLANVVALEDGEWAKATATHTDLEGRFEVGVGRGPQLVGAFVRDGRAATVTVAAGAEPPPPLEIRLPEWGSMRGRLAGADPAGAQVLAYRSRRPDSLRAEDGTDIRDGYWMRSISPGYRFARTAEVEGDRFVVENVEPGSYYLRASTETAKGEGTFAHDDPDIVIRLQETGRVAFTITWDDGTPAEGHVRIGCEGLVTGPDIEDGAGESGQLPAGPCIAAFYPESGPVPAPTEIDVEPGENDVDWTIARDTVQVEGRVVDPAGAPIEGARVSVAIDNARIYWAGGEPGDIEYRGTTTGVDGRFSLAVGSLDVVLFVFREGYVSTTVLARDAALIRLEPGESEPAVRQKPRPQPETAPLKGRRLRSAL